MHLFALAGVKLQQIIKSGMHMRVLIYALLFVTGTAFGAEYGPDSPYYRYPAGVTLSLTRPLAIPPEAATVRLQFGRVVPSNGVQEVEPHCIFEVDTVGEREQIVVPQKFQVTDVRRGISTFAGLPVWPFGLAAIRVGSRDDGLPSHIYYKTEFRLRAAEAIAGQPPVRNLTCQSNQMSAGIPIAFMRHLTLDEIRQALGDYFRLDLP